MMVYKTSRRLQKFENSFAGRLDSRIAFEGTHIRFRAETRQSPLRDYSVGIVCGQLDGQNVLPCTLRSFRLMPVHLVCLQVSEYVPELIRLEVPETYFEPVGQLEIGQRKFVRRDCLRS